MLPLRLSTATTVVVGPFLLPTDGVTPVTGLSAPASSKVYLAKNGTTAAYTVASWTEIGNGLYNITYSTTDTNAVGRFRIDFADAANYSPVFHELTVLSQAAFDFLYGTTALPTNVTQVGGQTATASAAVAFPAAIGTSTYAGGAVASVTGSVGSVTGSVGSVTGSVGSVTGAVGSVTAAVTTTGTPNDSTGVGTLLTRLSTGRAANLDNIASGAVALATQIPASFTSALFTSAGVFSTGALVNAPTGGGNPWGTDLSTFTTPGTAGYVVRTNLDTNMASRSTYAGGPVASVTGAVGSVTGAVGSVTGAVGSVTGSVGSVTGSVGSVTAAVTTTGTPNDSAGIGTLLTRLSSGRATNLDNLAGGAVALAAQIPSGFTAALFVSPGVFADTALANAPAGGGGGGGGSGVSDWTSTEKAQLRYRLGVDGTVATPATNSPHLATGSISTAVPVNQDSGGAGNLLYVENLNPVGDGTVRAYLTSDFSGGRRGQSYIVGEVLTRADGTWISPMMLQPADYTFIFAKEGLLSAQQKRLNVS